MKTIIVRVLKLIFFPLICCRRIIQEAPVISCDNELLGFGDYRRFSAPQTPPVTRSRDAHQAPSPACRKAMLHF